MRIVLAGTLSGRGGVQTQLLWLSRALLESGHQVQVYSLAGALSEGDQARVRVIEELGYFEVITPYTKAKGALSVALVMIQKLRAFAPHAFIACGTGWNLYLPAIFSGCSMRRVFHEVMSGVPGGPRDSRYAVQYGFHEVIAQASPVGANFRVHFKWLPQVKVLPAFPEPLEVTAQLPEPIRNPIKIGTARAALFSRLVPHKGGLWLVRQWQDLSRSIAELHIHGTGPEEADIRALILENGWSDRVFLHGSYPEGREYVKLLSSYDLTLLPTTGAEGAPLVLLESMACGVPFVSFDVGGIPDYTNPDCMIVSAGRPESFLQAVAAITDRLAVGEVNHKRLQSFYLEHFSYSALKARWVVWLESMLSASQGRE